MDKIYTAANKALSLVLILAILGTGYLAIQMTHVSATICFGTEMKKFDEAISSVDLTKFNPPSELPIVMPKHKPSIPVPLQPQVQ